MPDTRPSESQPSNGCLSKILKLVPICSLSPHYQKEVLRNAILRSYAPGRLVFKQGSKDHFCFYLLEGELERISDGKISSSLHHESDSSYYPLAQFLPRRYSARVKTASKILLVNKHLLDKVSLLQEQETAKSDKHESLQVVDLSKTLDGQAGEEDWMVRMLKSDLFSKIPTANIYKLFALMKPMVAKPKQVIVRQGERGAHYYVIKKGRCAVLQKITPTKPLVKVAILGVGDSFGEESLINRSHRNASVVAMEPCKLMLLARKEFDELIKKPALRSLHFRPAEAMVNAGKAIWLDVRFPSEYRNSSLRNSLNLPIYLLRKKLSELNQKNTYIACCDNGERSSTAAFLLAQNGFNVYYLEKGLQKIQN